MIFSFFLISMVGGMMKMVSIIMRRLLNVRSRKIKVMMMMRKSKILRESYRSAKVKMFSASSKNVSLDLMSQIKIKGYRLSGILPKSSKAIPQMRKSS